MIKRHYFIGAEKPHGDGKGSYSFNSLTLNYRSWLPVPEVVYEQAAEHIAELMKDEPGKKIKIVSFNRI